MTLLEFNNNSPRAKVGESRLVYIAAPFNAREEAREAKELIETAGHVTTSTWILSHLNELSEINEEVAQGEAVLDLEAIRRCEVFVLLNNTTGTSSGGMHIEMGYAIAAGKSLLVVGDRTNIFHYLPNVRVVGRLTDVPDALTRYFKPRQDAPTKRTE